MSIDIIILLAPPLTSLSGWSGEAFAGRRERDVPGRVMRREDQHAVIGEDAAPLAQPRATQS
jgi:hypothetical protein